MLRSLWILLSFIPLGEAFASQNVYYDEFGMPACISEENDGELHELMIISEQKSHFKKQVSAFVLDDLKMDNGITSEKLSCRDWKKFRRTGAWRVELKDQDGFPPWVEGIKKDQSVVLDFSLPSRVIDADNQMLEGANQYHMESTAEEFLIHHPIEAYTLSTNRTLTRQYGFKFSTQIYKAWESQKPENLTIRNEVLTNISKYSHNPFQSIRERAAPYHFLVVLGFGQTRPRDGEVAPTFKPLFEDIKFLNLEYSIVDNFKHGTIELNTRMIEEHLQGLLNQGKKVVIFSMSKGVPEALLALGRITEKNTTAADPGKSGKVYGVITMSGVYDGCFLADLVNHTFGYGVIKFLVEQFMNLTHADPRDRVTAALKDMTYSRMKSVKDEYVRSLPRDIPYLNLTGVLENAKSTNKDVIHLQKYLSGFTKKQGANEGLVEFPGTSLHVEGFPNYYTMVVGNASHDIAEGTWEGYRLRDDGERKILISGILHTLFDHFDMSH